MSDLFTAEEIAQLRARNGIYGGWLVLHAWVLIAAACYLFVLWPNPLSFVLALMLIGSRQLGLLILMHDGAHNALAKSPGLNRILGQYLSAWPMLADMDIYRRYHLRHHVNTQTEMDPDNILTAHYPITRESLKRKLIRDVTGQSGFAQRREQLRYAMTDSPQWSGKLQALFRNLGPQLLANAVLFALFTLSGHWYLYFLLWLLPMLTWQQLVLRIRNIAEHAVVPDREDVYRNTRTTLASWLERVFIAPYWVNYHGEHHLAMWVPCYRLPLMRQMLAEKGITERMETQPGYLAVLRLAASRAPDQGDINKPRALGTFSGGYQ